MKCGEIWNVEFGNTAVGHEFRKSRPVLIIQSDEQLHTVNVITIIPFTSQKKKHRDDIIVPKDELNNLSFDSVLKVHHIQTFDQSRFTEKRGEANQVLINQVKTYLRKHFGI